MVKRDQAIRDALKGTEEDIRALEDSEALRIGRIAVDAGIADIRTTKAQLRKEFSALAETFPKRAGLHLLDARKAQTKTGSTNGKGSAHDRR